MISTSGFIDSSSYRFFERALENGYNHKTRFAILDLSSAHYINSTGISAIIRHFSLYRERSGMLILTAVPKSVGLSMHLLGVTSLIPFHKDIEEARERITGFMESGGKELEELEKLLPDREAARKKVLVPIRRRRSPLKDSKVMLITPKPTRFTRILGLRFRHLNDNFQVFHDPQKVMKAVDSVKPDLVVLDHRMDDKGELVAKLKMHPERSLISVIKIYKDGSQVDEQMDFKIWENDYLVDPFEILELFSLTEAELLRVPKDRKVFEQQIRFNFRSHHANLAKANRLSDLVVHQALDLEEDRTALCAAVKEGLDNSAIHGNRWDVQKTIDVNFLVDRSKVTVIIEDQGSGFDFDYYLSRLDDHETFEKARKKIEEGQRGGLGILLMHRCTDRIEYSGTGNILRLEKNRP
ncbi:MAG: ATP-binding protein [Planctomycetes bacterium]|nr:ATP-binding protein [Planctomycetota bacterium]